ncbi:selenide, water dikinase SelD [Reinekea blandensis]|uniref:Selenide, water dikinase n=1 Tax=Reinekea blandensis MED297 TaxID=314283 RepID=A4BES8_9GAMM|nr:selenide, water dikinase SelD [Reinekea blandensis]EAR09263.1 selenide, water dikinase [Reinekea sp. MED297] [Reinekea blandensis MED297]
MTIRLTQYSHGAGCGCKLSPDALSDILRSDLTFPNDQRLLVGNATRDDAAVQDLGDGTAIISTTDFFMPIADDPKDFGRIAAANAISDVYAMGGSPLMAIAILGWPLDKLSTEVAGQVMDGGRSICWEAGIPLAGGHSIDSPEPIFGLAVTGRVSLEHLKRNDTAQAGDLLYLTKPLGVGILTTAQKKDELRPEHAHLAVDSMTRLNRQGEAFGTLPYVRAMTDVTGFGLAGHLLEMCQGSGTAAIIDAQTLPLLAGLDTYIELGCLPGGTTRNRESCADLLELASEELAAIVCDPQTSGGLLVAVDPLYQADFEQQTGHALAPIGRMIGHQSGARVFVTPGV